MQSTYRYDVKSTTLDGLCPDNYADPPNPFSSFADADGSFTSRIIEIKVRDNPALLTFSYDGVTFGKDYEADPDDPPIQWPHAVRSFMIKNKTPGNVARYQIVGFA
jgi:hypothetical protein